MNASTIEFAPLLAPMAIALLALLGVAIALVGIFKGAPGGFLRLLGVLFLVVALFNPLFVHERRQSQSDVAIVAVDLSASQNVGDRRKEAAEAVRRIRKSSADKPGLEIREVEVHDGTNGNGSSAADRKEGTRLIGALRRAVGDVPHGRFAGAIIVTDGQVHDVDAKDPGEGLAAPVHVLLTGDRNEKDRRLVIDKAPGYGIVGEEISIVYHVEDGGAMKTGGTPAEVVLREGERVLDQATVPVGEKQTFTFALPHAGASIFEIAVAPVAGELSTLNNRSFISVNGVRDRLRVLLVSGQPHAGERMWRNLLKSDPSVDLVHFTIQRPPEKDDFTPLHELSLIAFPVRELFEVKLKEFDLIVFDRYVVRDVLPPSYFRNINEYVADGGAVLMSVGPEFAGQRSLFQTPLADIMPANPTGQVFERGFRPRLTELGRRHPVTADLPVRRAPRGPDSNAPQWGRWFRHIQATVKSGAETMTGVQGLPLLVLDRTGKGRVAQMLSDHIWLWARGFEGGGPQAELLRRAAHWLMKEPDLEEESLRAEVRGGKLLVRRTSLKPGPMMVTVKAPSGDEKTIALESGEAGVATGEIEATETGLYVVSDGVNQVSAASGSLNPLEFADLTAREDAVRPVAAATDGGVFWLADGMPSLRRTRPGRDSAGGNWLGLHENRAYVVTGVTQVPLLGPLILMTLALGLFVSAWWREGR